MTRRNKTMEQEQALIDILKDRNTLRTKVDTVHDVQNTKELSLRDLSLLHIQELTFEDKDKCPQKEAVENVISSLRMDGICFVYLLLGDAHGVSFYFGIAKIERQGALDLDVDEVGQSILKMNVEGNFRGSTTTIADKQKRQDILNRLQSAKRFARVDGVPSIYEDSESFQGIDRLVDVMLGDEFGMVMVADPLSHDEIQDIENTLYDISNRLGPLAKVSMQESQGETETEATTVTKNDSEAIGENTGYSSAKTTGTSSSETTGISSSETTGTSSSKTTGSSSSKTTGTSSSDTMGVSSSETTGTSKSVTAGTSESSGGSSNSSGTTKSSQTGSNEGRTEGRNKGTTEGKNKGTTEGQNKGTTEGRNKGATEGKNRGTTEGRNKGTTETESNGNSTTKTIGSSESLNKSTALNKGSSTTREVQSKLVSEWLSYIDEVLIKRLDYGRNKGIFHVGTYIFADQKGTLVKLGHTLRAIFSGSDENKAPLNISMVDVEYEKKAIKHFQLARTNQSLTANEKMARVLFSKQAGHIGSWMSVKELSVMAALPQKEVVGLALKEEVEFGLNVRGGQAEGDALLLGHLVKSGTVLETIPVHISKKNLNKHTFICGVTGSGKTTTCQRLLDSAEVPFMVIEPAKTEYRVLTQKYDDITIFTLGNEKVAPFRLNPFEFFEGENISSRVDMIKANIEAAFDMEAAIPQLIEAALYRCYENYGWDIGTSTNQKFEHPFADGVYAFPTLSDLIRQTEPVVSEQGFDDRLKSDYIGSIKARLNSLIVGAKGFMLDTPRSVDFTDLVERNVILELEEIKSGAEKSLIMGFVLINLNEAIKMKHRQYQEQNQQFKHITLVEEAHRLLSKFVPGDNPSKKLGVETFSDMLAEVRKYGESLIIVDQIPNKLTPEVLKNTNTKIVHKLFASDDKEAIGNTMALNDEQKDFLSNLEVGRVIVSSQDLARPIQVQIQELDDISTTSMKPVGLKEIRQTALKYYQEQYQTGIVFGLHQLDSTPDLDVVEAYLKLPFKRLLDGWAVLFKTKTSMNEQSKKGVASVLQRFEVLGELGLAASHVWCSLYQHQQDDVSEQDVLALIEALLQGKEEFSREEGALFRLR